MSAMSSITHHIGLVVTVIVSKSGPATLAPSVDIGVVGGASEISIAVGKPRPMSSHGVGAELIFSVVIVDVGIANIGASMSAPSCTKFVGSGESSSDKMIMEFRLFLINVFSLFTGSDDCSDSC